MKISNTLILILLLNSLFGQGLGVGTLNPTIARFEVSGVAGSGTTAAVFGSDGHGVSFQRNFPAIGFNQYRDNATVGSLGKYMANGFATTINFDQTTGILNWEIFTSGIKDANTSNPETLFSVSNIGNIGILDKLTIDATLVVGNNSSKNALISGSAYDSKFGYDTYINGGKANSKVFLNDIPGGKIIIGSKTVISDNANLNNLKVSLEVNGAIAFTFRDDYQPCGNISYDAQNNSYVNVNPSCGSAEMKINDGIVEGQLLIIQAEGNNDFLIKDANNINLPADLAMGGGDILMLMWSFAAGQWLQVSYSNN